MTYRTRIATIAPDVPAHYVEAYMRAEYGPLDALTKDKFRTAALVAAMMARLAEPAFNDALAATYGLRAA